MKETEEKERFPEKYFKRKSFGSKKKKSEKNIFSVSGPSDVIECTQKYFCACCSVCLLFYSSSVIAYYFEREARRNNKKVFFFFALAF